MLFLTNEVQIELPITLTQVHSTVASALLPCPPRCSGLHFGPLLTARLHMASLEALPIGALRGVRSF